MGPTMTRQAVRRLSNIEIDEISLVDRPANQHATVAIAKRDEDTMTVMLDIQGRETDLDEFEPGEPVFDPETREHVGYACEEGKEPSDYGWDVDEVTGEVAVDETSEVGKAWGGQMVRLGLATIAKSAPRQWASKSLGQSVYEELSKALGDSDRDGKISKAFEALAFQTAEANARAERAEQVVGTLVDRIQTDEISEIVKSYGVGQVEPLTEIFKNLDPNQASYLDGLLSQTGAAFAELGTGLGQAEDTTMGQIEAMASEVIAKSDVTKEAAVTALFSANTDAYDAYLAESN